MDGEDKKDRPNNNNSQQQQHRFPPLLEQPYYSSSFEQHSAAAATTTTSSRQEQQQQQETGAANNNQRMMKAAFHEVVELAPVESAESNKRQKLLHDVQEGFSSLTPVAADLRTGGKFVAVVTAVYDTHDIDARLATMAENLLLLALTFPPLLFNLKWAR